MFFNFFPRLDRMKWKKKSPSLQKALFSPRLFGAFILILFLLMFFLYRQSPKSLFGLTDNSSLRHGQESLCNSRGIRSRGERLLWYGPHSGFSNQLSEFKNAALMAAILNRTLIVPPILDHHAVALGSCPKFRVLTPNDLRFKVWDHSIELLRTGRYVSMGDIIDLNSLTSLNIPTIDFREFVSTWCDVDLKYTCLNDNGIQSSVLDKLKQCGSSLSGLEGNFANCLYSVGEDCRTTVWTYQKNVEDGSLDAFQPDEQLRLKKKITYFRRRRDVYTNLGPGTIPGSSSILAFGSLFTSPYKGTELYIDIHESQADSRIQSVIEKIEYLPFVHEIESAAEKFVHKVIQQPFLCTQLRLLDGQFKNHWKATFSVLRQKVDSLIKESSTPIHIFIMTDLPVGNWIGTYLGDLQRDTSTYKLHFLKDEDELVRETAKKVASTNHGLRKLCPGQILPDILLYIEETICSCGSLGFVGTAGSTIAESVEVMRKKGITLANLPQDFDFVVRHYSKLENLKISWFIVDQHIALVSSIHRTVTKNSVHTSVELECP
ncbi:hypothetical protein V2J09_014743 [Rumex salicifolius]